MNNVSMQVKGNTLVITVDLTKRLGPSTSGKNEKIASTGGNVIIAGGPDGSKLGLNVFCPLGK